LKIFEKKGRLAENVIPTLLLKKMREKRPEVEDTSFQGVNVVDLVSVAIGNGKTALVKT
jgi:hypothetical protein